MHAEALKLMEKHLYRQLVRSDIQHPTLLDVGSRDINGTYRPMCKGRGFLYTGVDIVEGPNVDVVSANPYFYPFDTDSFDVVICGNMLHNVAHPWSLILEMARLVKPNGLLCVVTIWRWGINSHPVDYFRFTKDGLRVLFDETELLTEYRLEQDDDGNTAGSALKIGR